MSDTDERFNRASALWDKGRMKEAFHLFLAAAQDGDLSCYLNVGYCFDTGLGVRKNREKALSSYMRAHRRGDSSATHNIGTMYRDSGMKARALQWFHRALKRGDADSALEIGKIYLKEKNTPHAIRYLKMVVKSDSVCEDTVSEASALLRAALRAPVHNRRRR